MLGRDIRSLSLTGLLAAALLLAGANAATAGTATYDGNVATSIANLMVEGLDPAGYNVTFVEESSASLYGGVFDFDNSDDAAAAAMAINDLLNADNIATQVAPSAATCEGLGGDILCGTYGIGYGILDGGVQTAQNGGFYLGAAENWIGSSDPIVTTDNRIWASFEVVPEPGTALLMGLGMAGLGLAGRRQRRA